MSDPNRPPSDLAALAEVLAERAREHAGPGGDPEPEELLDYLEGRLSPEAEEEVGRRLLASPDASRDLLDLSELARAGGEDDPADFAARSGWRDFQRRLGGEAPGATAGGADVRRPRRALVALASLAAGLFVAALGLSFQLWRLERTDRPESPVLVANVRTLELEEGLRSDRVPAVEVEPGEPFQGVLFPPEPCPAYRVEIAGPGEGEPLRRGGLEVDELGRLAFLLRGEPGRYTLRLFGCEPERELSSYGFEIARPGDTTSERDGS